MPTIRGEERGIWVMMGQFETDPLKPRKWRAIHCSGRQMPYVYLSVYEAREMLNLCYPVEDRRNFKTHEITRELRDILTKPDISQHTKDVINNLLTDEDNPICFYGIREPAMAIYYPEIFTGG